MSTVLSSVVAGLADENIRIGELVAHLRRRSFGGLFIVLALVGLVPGVSVFVGPLMIVPALQMFVGLRSPVLPRFARRREVEIAKLKSLLQVLTPRLLYLEKFIRPRWTLLTNVPMPNLVGLVIFALALVITLPLPFSNLLPAFAVILLSLALLERDGLVLIVGMIVSLAAFILGAAAVVTFLAGAEAALARLIG